MLKTPTTRKRTRTRVARFRSIISAPLERDPANFSNIRNLRLGCWANPGREREEEPCLSEENQEKFLKVAVPATIGSAAVQGAVVGGALGGPVGAVIGAAVMGTAVRLGFKLGEK